MDRLWISGKFVPKPIEIDALAPGDEPLDVGTAEIEMPESRAADDLVPLTYARERRVDDGPPGHAIGELCGERVADHIADIVGH